MRVDPKGDIGRFPVLLVRKVLRRLRNQIHWTEQNVQKAAGLNWRRAAELIRELQKAGLAEASPERGPGWWSTTSTGMSFAAASAAKPITRQTAERALGDLLDRVAVVNKRGGFLAKVTKVVVFGSYLRTEVDRLGDVDVAVELQPKEPDPAKLRKATYARVALLEGLGRRFDGYMDKEGWWRREALQFLKGRSRAISLHDYSVEKELIDAVPHRELSLEGRRPRARTVARPSRLQPPSDEEWF